MSCSLLYFLTLYDDTLSNANSFGSEIQLSSGFPRELVVRECNVLISFRRRFKSPRRFYSVSACLHLPRVNLDVPQGHVVTALHHPLPSTIHDACNEAAKGMQAL